VPTSTWRPEYTARALELWEAYQRQHDLSIQVGKVAAIDPVSGRVWIDEPGVDVVAQMRSEGADVPVYFVRIGCPSFIKRRSTEASRSIGFGWRWSLTAGASTTR
jgi:hypothetical protein